MTVRVAGIGTALPDTVVTNLDLERTLDTTDEWIRDRAGIAERRTGGVTSELAARAGKAALADAGMAPDDIDLLILATCTPDQRFPATSATVQADLGLTCGALDVNAVCAGFTYAYITAYLMMTAPTGPEKVLVCGTDTLSAITDWTDRNTAILFGDGSGAVVLERHEQGRLLGWDAGADGNLKPILFCDHDGFIQMEGREVFKKAVRAVVGSVEAALAQAGLTPADIDVLLPHQANIRIIEAVCQRLDVSMEITHNVLEHTGNTSSASIPLTMAAAADNGVLHPGSIVCMTGFGAGMAWASAVVEW